MFYLKFFILIFLTYFHFFVILCFLISSLYLYKYIHSFSVRKKDSQYFKIKNFTEFFLTYKNVKNTKELVKIVLFVILVILMVLVFIFFRRILNMGNSIDLYLNYVNLKMYLYGLSYAQIVLSISLVISVLIFLFLLSILLQQIFFDKFLKLHLYILSKEPIYITNYRQVKLYLLQPLVIIIVY